MIGKFEIDDEVVKICWKTKKEQRNIYKWLNPFSDFKAFNVYSTSAELFSFCFKGHANTNGSNLKMIDYGYALDPESIEKYILNNYADDENEYLVCAELMAIDYEKYYYKNGPFINQDGKVVGDFYLLDNCEELKKKAYSKNNWITFVVYDINKNCSGETLLGADKN